MPLTSRPKARVRASCRSQKFALVTIGPLARHVPLRIEGRHGEILEAIRLERGFRYLREVLGRNDLVGVDVVPVQKGPILRTAFMLRSCRFDRREEDAAERKEKRSRRAGAESAPRRLRAPPRRKARALGIVRQGVEPRPHAGAPVPVDERAVAESTFQ
jgi:hypothetical protein